MQVVETAFEWVSAQRVVNFEVSAWESEVDLFMAFNYFVIEADSKPKPEDSQDSRIEVLHLLHKRSPHFRRDLIRPLPDLNLADHKQIAEVKVIQALHDKWNSYDRYEVLKADFRRASKSIKRESKTVARDHDQLITKKELTDYIIDHINVKKEYIYDLCPTILDWREGWNFDLLTNDWPKTMCYAFPPETHAAATMNRAMIKSMDGTDCMVLVKENKVNRTSDKIISRKIGIHFHVGSPIFEPYREQSKDSYGLYLFFTPATIGRIYLKKNAIVAKSVFDEAWTKAQKEFDAEFKEVLYEIAARMHWSGLSVNKIQTFMKGEHYAKKDLKPYVEAIAEVCNRAIPDKCVQ